MDGVLVFYWIDSGNTTHGMVWYGMKFHDNNYFLF